FQFVFATLYDSVCSCELLILMHVPTLEISTLSLHDALPIWDWERPAPSLRVVSTDELFRGRTEIAIDHYGVLYRLRVTRDLGPRSEEHTSELQSRENLVCRLLLEKKKNGIA